MPCSIRRSLSVTIAPLTLPGAKGHPARASRMMVFRHRGRVRFPSPKATIASMSPAMMAYTFWVDGDLIIDQWRDTSAVTYTAERHLSGGHGSRSESSTTKIIKMPPFASGGSALMPSRAILIGAVNIGRIAVWMGIRRWCAMMTRLISIGVPVRPIHALPRDNFSVRWTQPR